jgi:hypothetical protein
MPSSMMPIAEGMMSCGELFIFVEKGILQLFRQPEHADDEIKTHPRPLSTPIP